MGIQLEILMFFQSIRSNLLNAIFLLLTISTELPVIVLVSAAMYWCFNKRIGQRLLFSLISNFVINVGIKEFVKAPRPIGIQGLKSLRVSTATGYSFPSGHTQSATSFWATLIILIKQPWVYIVGTVMIIGVGISRLYLAVHWPVDVIFGWIFGILLSIIFVKIFDYVDENKKYWILIILLIIFGIIGYFLNSDSYIEYLGIMTGFIIGYIVEDVFIKFKTEQNTKRNINFSKYTQKQRNHMLTKLIRFILGVITLVLSYIVLKVIVTMIPNYFTITNINNFNALESFFRYAILIFIGIAGVPALFKVFKLEI